MLNDLHFISGIKSPTESVATCLMDVEIYALFINMFWPRDYSVSVVVASNLLIRSIN